LKPNDLNSSYNTGKRKGGNSDALQLEAARRHASHMSLNYNAHNVSAYIFNNTDAQCTNIPNFNTVEQSG